MSDRRGALEVEDLLKVVLVLVALWLVLQVVTAILKTTAWFLSLLPTLLGVAVVILIVLWLTDRI